MARNEILTASSPTANKPQLAHTPSKQSVAGSEDYYSLSDNATSHSNSLDSKVTIVRYETPPSRFRTPQQSSEALQSQNLRSQPTLPPSGQRSEYLTPLSTRQIRPVPADSPQPAVSQSSQPNPAGTVRFDEAQIAEQQATGSAIPREGPKEGPGKMDESAPTPVDDTPYIRFAIDQLTRDEELAGRGRQGSVADMDYPVERIVPNPESAYYNRRKSARSSRIPPRKPVPSSSPVASPVLTGDDVFRAIEAPTSHRYPSLDFVPAALRLPAMLSIVLACILMIAGIIFSNVWSLKHNGIWDYAGDTGGRYFVFQFLPQLLAMIILIWLFIIKSAVYRTLPFISLSSDLPSRRTRATQNLPLFSTHFFLPDLSYFKNGEPLLGMCMLVFWLQNFTIPLQSGLFQTRFYGAWRWTSVQGVGWALLVFYVLLIIALIVILIRFHRARTGLMWDPVSLADYLPLLARSNITSDFDRSETFSNLRRQTEPKSYRLGYWVTSQHPSVIFHAIGSDGAPVRKPWRNGYEEKDVDFEAQRASRSSTMELHSYFVRHRWTPWFLRETFVIAWMITAIILLIAFLAVSFIHHAIRTGFLPLLPTAADKAGFSSSNFLYSFMPSLLGMMLFLAWQPIDTYFRALQPFADLASANGATAEKTLLLSYNSTLPIQTTFLALINKHYKVAITSFIGFTSLAIPVLAGGVFTAQFFSPKNQIRIAASMPAFYALIFFVVIYALSFLALWPGHKRYLPHDIRTIADLVSYLYSSPLLEDQGMESVRSKIDLVTKLCSVPAGESALPKYGFGVYRGIDGHEHLGIDRRDRPGRDSMLLNYEEKV